MLPRRIVPRYWTTRRFNSLRRCAISKIAALFLATLCLLPFLAPFKTFDIAGSHGDRSYGSLPKDEGDSDEHLVSPPHATLFPPHLKVVVVAPRTRPGPLDEHPPASTVLRV